MPPPNNAVLHTRLLTPADSALLAALPCTASPIIEQFIREDLAHATATNARPLGMFLNGGLVAVACHRANERLGDMDYNVIPGTELELIAIADAHRDTGILPHVLAEIRADIATRNRGDFIAIYVNPENPDGVKLAHRFAATQDGPSDDDIAWFTTLDKLI